MGGPHHVTCGILVPRLGLKPVPPVVKVWSPNHSTAREFLELADLHLENFNILRDAVHLMRTGYQKCQDFIKIFILPQLCVSDGKESYRFNPIGQEDSPGEGHRNPLQYFCLENFMDRGAWWATVHGIAKSQTQKVTNTHMHKKKNKG